MVVLPCSGQNPFLGVCREFHRASIILLQLCLINFDTKGGHHPGAGDQLTLAQLQRQLLEEYGEQVSLIRVW